MRIIESKIMNQLVDWMHQAGNVVVFTGSGMSTESGMPDFRSQEGIWKKYDPYKLATPEAIEKNYTDFHNFYKNRIEVLSKCEPNHGHRILAKWERDGYIHTIVTQNVDGFHQVAGNQQVYSLHGDMMTCRCNQCGRGVSTQAFLEKVGCIHCKSDQLRPNIVLFGEALSRERLIRAEEAIMNADLLLVIGTSLLVSPANHLPTITKGRTVYINHEYDNVHVRFDLIIEGEVGDILKQVDEGLNCVKAT